MSPNKNHFSSARTGCRRPVIGFRNGAGGMIFAMAAMLLSPLVWADNSIDTVAVSRGTAGRTVIKMTLKEPLAAAPAGFSINNPPRIALDFPATGNGTGRSVQEVGDPVLRSLNIVRRARGPALFSIW